MEDFPLIYVAKAIAILLILAVAYLFGSFTSWSFNPLEWGSVTRWVVGIPTLIACAMELDTARGSEE